MKELSSCLSVPVIIDHSYQAFDYSALPSFALDELLCRLVGSGLHEQTIRTWVHSKTVVLGMLDMRLPHLQQGLDYLQSNNFCTMTRNSGGLAVALDENVLNISLITQQHNNRIEITKQYESMVTIIHELLKPCTDGVEVGEIAGSYCPGKYDLSIEGRKFGGICQRNSHGASLVQAYIGVSGNGSERAQLISDFYHYAGAYETSNARYPHIVPSTMVSLSEVLNREILIADLTKRFIETSTIR